MSRNSALYRRAFPESTQGTTSGRVCTTSTSRSLSPIDSAGGARRQPLLRASSRAASTPGPARGRSREELTVANGKTLLARAKVAMKRVTYNRVYSVRWLVPRTVTPATASFCAVAIDPAGRRSPKACSPLEIS